jgi:hypothetical protein
LISRPTCRSEDATEAMMRKRLAVLLCALGPAAGAG